MIFTYLLGVVSVHAGSTAVGDAAPAQLRWRPGAVRIAVSTSVTRQNSNIKYGSDVAGAVSRSVAAWQRVVDLNLIEVASEKQSMSPAGARGDGVSLITIAQTPENLLLFAQGTDDAAATTRIFFDRRGFITEADIVLNPFLQFSTDGTIGTFDLESTLTHEIGHLLGLQHSDVIGATMYERYAKNGILGSYNTAARSLSLSDITAIRGLYGPLAGDEACCGRLSGRLAPTEAKGKNWQVWTEDADTGLVVSQTTTAADGSYRFTGLPETDLKVFAQERAPGTGGVAESGIVSVKQAEPIALRHRSFTRNNFQLQYLGLNAQLSDIAISVKPGNTYTVYLGGVNLDPKRIMPGFTSPFFSVVPHTLESLDYGPDVSVIAFQMRVDPSATPGEYTVFAGSEGGLRRYIVGGVTVESGTAPGLQTRLNSIKSKIN